jgi:hypothetical protein
MSICILLCTVTKVPIDLYNNVAIYWLVHLPLYLVIYIGIRLFIYLCVLMFIGSIIHSSLFLLIARFTDASTYLYPFTLRYVKGKMYGYKEISWLLSSLIAGYI